MLLVDSILLLSPFVQTSPLAEEKVIDSSSVKKVSGKTGRGKGGRGSKGSGRPSDSRGRDRKGKGRGRSELVMVHRVLKSVSSAVRMIIGRVIVQRRMLARRI